MKQTKAVNAFLYAKLEKEICMSTCEGTEMRITRTYIRKLENTL